MYRCTHPLWLEALKENDLPANSQFVHSLISAAGNPHPLQKPQRMGHPPTETVGSGNFNAVAGDYFHELANLVDYQMNQSIVGKMETNYGDPNYVDRNTGKPDPDTGAQVEIRMFGATQY